MKVSFRIQRRAIRNAEVVEIWCGDEFIGYLDGLQDECCGVKITSKFFAYPSAAAVSLPDMPPALEIRFKKEDTK